MKKIKRIIACLCVCVLLVSAPTTSYARAYTYVNPTGAEEVLVIGGLIITTETALGWALSLLGFTAAANAIYENRDAWIGWCNDQADRIKKWFSARADDLSVTWGEFENWLGDIRDGALDTTSECWDTFLDFCSDLATHSSGYVTPDDSGAVGWSSIKDEFTVWQDLSSKYYGPDGWKYERYPDRTPYATTADSYITCNLRYSKRYSSGTYDLGYSSCGSYAYADYEKVCAYYDAENGEETLYLLSTNGRLNQSIRTVLVDDDIITLKTYLVFTDVSALENYINGGLIDFSAVTAEFIPEGWTFTDVGEFVQGYGLPWEGDNAGTVNDPIYGDLSDVIVAPDTQGVIERDGNLDNVGVADVTGTIVGELTIPVDGITGLDVVSTPYVGVEGVYPVDIIGGVILGTDTPIDGIKPGVVPTVNGDYTIKGLQELFPFCIPFDLVSLFRTLAADAEAPCFKLPVPVPKKNWEFEYIWIELDFSKFNSAAKIFRTMELLGFCVGLTLITRNLIRG